MNQPKALLQFKRKTHGFYTAYVMANEGMAQKRIEFEELEGVNPNGQFQIGSRSNPVAEMSTKNALSGMQKDGGFSQIIAYSMIVWIYSIWEEDRARIAEELEAETNDVLCDVMGDIRLLRNWIAHDNVQPAEYPKKLTTFDLTGSSGVGAITGDDMLRLQKAINTMQVYLRPDR